MLRQLVKTHKWEIYLWIFYLRVLKRSFNLFDIGSKFFKKYFGRILWHVSRSKMHTRSIIEQCFNHLGSQILSSGAWNPYRSHVFDLSKLPLNRRAKVLQPKIKFKEQCNTIIFPDLNLQNRNYRKLLLKKTKMEEKCKRMYGKLSATAIIK